MKHKEITKKLGDIKILQSWVVLLFDMLLSMVASLFSLFFIDAFLGVSITLPVITMTEAICIVTSIIPFYFLHTYRKVIRHSGLKDVLLLCSAAAIKNVLFYFASYVVWKDVCTQEVLIFGCLADFMLTALFLVVSRALMLFVYDNLRADFVQGANGDNILIYGIGKKSVSLLNFFTRSRFYNVVGFLAYDTGKTDLSIEDYRVYGFRKKEDLDKVLNRSKVRYIIFPTYADLAKEKTCLVKFSQENGIKMLISPNIDQVHPNNGVLKLGIREIKIEDLLGRDEIEIDMTKIAEHFTGKTVMVTGAAGSIGSELCRQLAKNAGVSKLIMLDAAETPLHYLRLQMDEKYAREGLKLVPIIADVRLVSRLDYIFKTHRPNVVFHAAAYKHVPLMQENPCEAVFVNIVGSKNVADMAVKYGAEKFVMISTDKAVNPTSVMGTTKRVAEMYVQSLHTDTKFITTRFGNVLGSNGSVIPRFREQIEKGGPLTVTSDKINRFFMSIPEACRLVLSAATFGDGGDILVFDMGEPVKIIDLATKMIKLAGYTPGVDIKINITGLRKGEKLYEEVLADTETTLPTENPKIRRSQVRESDNKAVSAAIEEFEKLARKVDIEGTMMKLHEVVPEYNEEN